MSIFNKLLDSNEGEGLPGDAKEEEPKNADFFCCFSIKKYFDVEQQQIKDRMRSAILLRPPFREVVGSKPDLYGPFWISTTLIVILVVSSSLVTYFETPEGQKINYNFDQIPVASFLIYGICFGSPYVIAIIVKVFGSAISVVELTCVYGYSLTIFLPITAFCSVHSAIIQTVLLVIAYFSSAVFLIRGILSMDRKLGDKERMVMGIFIMGVQLILVLMYKFYFFNLI